MGTQSKDRGGRQQGQGDQQRRPGGESRPDQQNDREKQPGTGQERLASDDDAGGDFDADGEKGPGQSGNAERERSGSKQSRNPS
jgi:hypothetical protein